MKNRKLLLICCLMAASCLSSCDDTTTEKLNWHQGLTMPSSNISAVEGDFYFDVDDGIIYSYKNNSWKVVLTLGGGNGNANKSAYEVYKTIFADYDKSELEWSKELVEGTLKAPKTYTVTFDSQNGTYSFTKIVTERWQLKHSE